MTFFNIKHHSPHYGTLLKNAVESDIALCYIRLKGKIIYICKGGAVMSEIYITITGQNHYLGMKPFKVGRRVRLVKDTDNGYDSEAVRVELPYIDTIGYVANSTYTVYDGTQIGQNLRQNRRCSLCRGYVYYTFGRNRTSCSGIKRNFR